ncbi:hypothetical protein ACEU07_20955 [Chromobacterium violaceum]|uniref:hypothetical protein n=1 Tax=Chromobacterium violaceum TaxID=536 RepID=UPI0035A71213
MMDKPIGAWKTREIIVAPATGVKTVTARVMPEMHADLTELAAAMSDLRNRPISLNSIVLTLLADGIERLKIDLKNGSTQPIVIAPESGVKPQNVRMLPEMHSELTRLTGHLQLVLGCQVSLNSLILTLLKSGIQGLKSELKLI